MKPPKPPAMPKPTASRQVMKAADIKMPTPPTNKPMKPPNLIKKPKGY